MYVNDDGTKVSQMEKEIGVKKNRENEEHVFCNFIKLSFFVAFGGARTD